MDNRGAFVCVAMLAGVMLAGCQNEGASVQRPEKILSMRQVVYDKPTYATLDSLWREYNEAYPSEEAYANWMYAARYAGNPNYTDLLEKGARLYPANPTLLYLRSMLHHGKPANLEAQALLERAVELDPSYMDPWFSLVIHYMERGEKERMDVALRTILESGIIADEVMDYSYNLVACLEKDAILVTNGDNDTYPGWILTRIVGYRPDIRLVNRSMLNTEWYPLALVEEGIPRLITSEELDSLRAALKDAPPSPAGPFGDALIERLAQACRRAGRPLYFSATLYHTEPVKQLLAPGRDLGLVTLVTPPSVSEAGQVRGVVAAWLAEFRTAGLDGWGLHYADDSRAGKMLVRNYGAALKSLLDRIANFAPEGRSGLFRWYRDHVVPVLPAAMREEFDRMWCDFTDITEISDWCRSRNLLN